MKRIFWIVTAAVMLISLALPMCAQASETGILLEDDFSDAVATATHLNNGEGSYTVADGVLTRQMKFTNQFGLIFTAQTEGKLKLTFDFKLSNLEEGVIAGLGTTAANVGKNVIAPLCMHNASGGAFTMSAGRWRGGKGPIPAPETNEWYTCTSIIDLTNKGIATTVTNRETGMLLGVDVYDEMPNTDADWRDWSLDNNVSYNLFLTVGGISGYNTIDNVKLTCFYNVPSVTEESITVTNCGGMAEKDFLSIDPAVEMIAIDFGTEINEKTATSDNIYLKEANGDSVPIDVGYADGAVTAVIGSMLKPNTNYTLHIEGDIANVTGEILGEDKTFAFKTNSGSISVTFGQFTDDSESLNVPLMYINSTENSITPGLIMAFYSADGRLVSAELIDGDRMEALSQKENLIYSFATHGVEKYDSYKLMIWEGFSNRRPVSNSQNPVPRVESSKEEDALSFEIGEGEALGSVKVTGIAPAANDLIGITVLLGANADLSSLKAGAEIYNPYKEEEKGTIAYLGDCVSNEDGRFETEFILPLSGEYSVFLTSRQSGSGAENKKFAYVDNAKYLEVINELNNFADMLTDNESYNDAEALSGFKSTVISNLFTLGVDDEYTAIANLDKVCDMFLSEIKLKRLDSEQKPENKRIWKRCVSVVVLNARGVSDITPYISELNEESDCSSYYRKYITEPLHKEYLTDKMSGRNLSGYTDLKKAYDEAIVLTIIKYPDGYMNIQDLFENTKSVTGITNVTNKASVYRDLAGRTFDNIFEAVAEYQRLISEAESTGSVSGGGSKSSSGGSISSGETTIQFTENKEQVQPVKMKFTDLDTAMWAYEAISSLSDKGIVNGISETKFEPLETVKREEFVKMTLLALGLEISKTENRFSDVSESEWFADYVNFANKISLVNGIGDGLFGVGENIKRQDIAVILYNALRTKEVNSFGQGVEFTDSSDISDYAYESVYNLSALKIIKGNDDGSFNPHGVATRAEAAQMIFGMLRILD